MIKELSEDMTVNLGNNIYDYKKDDQINRIGIKVNC